MRRYGIALLVMKGIVATCFFVIAITACANVIFVIALKPTSVGAFAFFPSGSFFFTQP